MSKLKFKVGDLVVLVPSTKKWEHCAGRYIITKLQSTEPESHPYSMLKVGGTEDDFYGANESELRYPTKLDKVLK